MPGNVSGRDGHRCTPDARLSVGLREQCWTTLERYGERAEERGPGRCARRIIAPGRGAAEIGFSLGAGPRRFVLGVRRVHRTGTVGAARHTCFGRHPAGADRRLTCSTRESQENGREAPAEAQHIPRMQAVLRTVKSTAPRSPRRTQQSVPARCAACTGWNSEHPVHGPN